MRIETLLGLLFGIAVVVVGGILGWPAIFGWIILAIFVGWIVFAILERRTG